MLKRIWITIMFFGLFFSGSAMAQEEVVNEVVKNTVNYSRNYDWFVILVVLGAVLSLAVFTTYLNNVFLFVLNDTKEQWRKKLKDNSVKGLVLLLALTTLTWSNPAMAFSLSSVPGTSIPITVENSDLAILVTIDLILLGLFIFQRRMFKIRAKMVVEGDDIYATSTFRSINKLLTDAVEVEDEDAILLDHEFDGIRELDNNLPPWWVAMFWATIVFSVVYIFHYHVFKTGDLQEAEYNKAMAKAQVEVQAYLKASAMNVDETNATIMKDASDLAAGQVIYEDNCVVCHREKGQGDIGPNLTDDYWLFDSDIKTIFKIIKKGTDKGMPDHASKLNPIQIQQVSSYVWSLPYAEGKGPEGEKMEKKE